MKSVAQIETWLKDNSISNYVLSNDNQIIVQGNVNLNGKLDTLKKLPVKFKDVHGYFDISNNELTSLEGCPQSVLKDFNCSHNNLESLMGGPKKANEFDCSYNKLKNLSYCPKEVFEHFNCSHNELVSIKGSPRNIKGHFNCSNNKLSTLNGAPNYIDMNFDCSFNSLDELSGGPLTVGQDYLCNNNKLRDLDSIADQIGWDVICDIRLNHLMFSSDSEDVYKYKGSELISHIYKPLVALTNKDDISKWLLKHGIKDFKILDDNSVDVKESVKLSNKLANLSKLPLSFNEVEGNFDISDNELISLEGAPNIVRGDFLAFKNELSSLKGSPKEVDGNFVVLRNNISSLKFAPSLVKDDFICSHNPLKDLSGINKVQGSIFTGVYLPNVKSQKYVYNSVATYKYSGELVCQYLDEVYVSLTDEERAFEDNRRKLASAITKMIDSDELKKEMITDALINNLSKYHLDEIKEKILLIKYPPKEEKKEELSEAELLKLAFEAEI